MSERHEPSPCPEPEVLALFIDGRLEGETLRHVSEHLAVCDDCTDVMRAAHPPEEATNVVSMAARRRPRWMAVAAAIAICVSLAAVALLLRDRIGATRGGMSTLAAAAPSTYRTVEPRLTGFRWAELRRLRDDSAPPSDPEWLRLAGAAGEVLQKANEDASTDAAHAAGVASLLIEQPQAAVERLRSAAEKSPSSPLLNDLAAAQYALATGTRNPSALPEALAAADAAIRLDARNAEAHFNRALILERMGLHRDAAAAWRAYLALDATSQWANEARRRLAAIEKPSASFRSEIAALERGDRATVERIVRAFPQESRKWFETDVLGRQPPDLSAARVVGAVLRERGESLLADAVGAAPRVTNAHAVYRRGRLRYRDLDLAGADDDLRAAEREFGDTPMARAARFYRASIRLDQNRNAEAAAMLDALIPAIPPNHQALAAEARALRARCALYDGRWSDAAADFSAAAATFRKLGETHNLAIAEAGLGEAWTGLGEREAAWSHRLIAFDLLSRGDGNGRLVVVAAAARTELRDERLGSAAALLRIEIDEAERGGRPLLIADAYKRRALLHARTGATVAGLDDLRAARRLLAQTNDSGVRKRIEAAAAMAEGTLARKADAKRSVMLLTAAVEFLRDAGERFGLAEALLERGRSQRALGAYDAAEADFMAGLAEVDRRAIVDTAESLFEETVDLLLSRERNDEAFALAERLRGGGAMSIPANLTIVEYVMVPDGVAAFHATSRGLDVVRVRTDRASLHALVRRLREDIVRRAPSVTMTASSSALYELLVAPLPLGNASQVVIVADGVLRTIPWPALYDRNAKQYLVERTELAIAPSAKAWIDSRVRASNATSPRLLLVTNDSRSDLDLLDNLRLEIDALAAVYPDRQILAGDDATPARFIRAANECDVIHFAGHARGTDSADESALLLAGELRASDIERAQLQRPRLAVLAACSTLGADSIADAFLAAGVPSIIGTLWPIDDTHAARLFGELHRRLRAGDAPAAALRHAQLMMLRSNDTNSHPAAWAGAELLGG
jgi:CHAT domain-containing protein